MIFLIEYDRSSGRVVRLTEFSDAGRVLAEDARLRRELQASAGKGSREIVLLEAASQDALRKTHRRYFESLEELAVAPDNG